MDRKAKIIILEGISGSGKTTQLERVSDYLDTLGYIITEVVEPREEVREWAHRYKKGKDRDPYVELAMFQADRIRRTQDAIEPSLNDRIAFLFGRSFISTYVYQGILGGVPLDLIERMNRFFPEPDVAFILDCEPEEALRRMQLSRGELSADEELTKLRTLRDGYRTIAKRLPYCRIIDANGSADQTFGNIRDKLQKVL